MFDCKDASGGVGWPFVLEPIALKMAITFSCCFAIAKAEITLQPGQLIDRCGALEQGGGCMRCWQNFAEVGALPVRRWLCCLVLGCCGFAMANLPPCLAETSREATTSKAARKEAIRSIPLAKIQPEFRRKVQHVLASASIYRRMPTLTADCHPELFTFLAQNPEVLVDIWRQLGISQVDLRRTGDTTFRLSDGAGTTGQLNIVEQKCDAQAQNRIVLYVEGQYEGKPFQRPVRTKCVLLLRSGSIVQASDGRPYVAARLDAFICVDRLSLKLLAKATQPWLGKTADSNFADTLQFISNFSQAAELRPERIQRLVNELPQTAQHQKGKLVQIAYQCGTTIDR